MFYPRVNITIYKTDNYETNYDKVSSSAEESGNDDSHQKNQINKANPNPNNVLTNDAGLSNNKNEPVNRSEYQILKDDLCDLYKKINKFRSLSSQIKNDFDNLKSGKIPSNSNNILEDPEKTNIVIEENNVVDKESGYEKLLKVINNAVVEKVKLQNI